MHWTHVIAFTGGLGSLGILAWVGAIHLRRRAVGRLEARYFDRWSDLSISQKQKVLSCLGVVVWPTYQPDALYEARLNDLFLAYLTGSAKDLGLGPFTYDTLPLSLLDVEVEWAFTHSQARRRDDKRSPSRR